MNREHSDGEDIVVETGTDQFVEATAETEVELRLPLEVDMEPDRIRKDILRYPALRNPVGSYRGPGHSR